MYNFFSLQGGFESVLNMCTQIMESSTKKKGVIQVRRLLKSDKEKLISAHKTFVSGEETVIALARRVLDADRFKANHNFYDIRAAMDGKTQVPREGFCFIGMISFKQNIADGADKLVKTCKHAGIKTVIVTSELTSPYSHWVSE